MAAWDTAGDLMDGGHGDQDGVVYSRPTAIRVDPDGVADDGGAGERDNVSPTIENIAGGSGDDVVIGSNGANSLNGGPGDDRLLGLGGADTLRGGPGRDRLIGGSGPDTLFGNHGIDTVDYSSRTVPISVDPDDIADDGAVDEHDNVRRSVENAVGGSAADQLTGNSEPNLLVGGAGGDTLTGHAGNDVLLGGPGFDLLTGNAGTDTCLVDEGGGSTSTCE